MFTLAALLAVGPMGTGIGSGGPGVDFSMAPDHVEVNNRILLKIGGKPISVMDVVRKMDMLFFRQYPELANEPAARYQFYTNSWRAMLANVIDDHLILADAEEKKIEVSEGEIREELEKLFGPDVVFNIDKMGVSFEEAWDLVKTELTVQRMTGMFVHMKALAAIHPIEVKRRYEKMLAENPPENKWIYQVVSLKGGEDGVAKSVAEKTYDLLAMQHLPLDMVKGKVEEDGIQFVLSAEYERTPKEISNSHRSVLEKLENGTYSAPVTKRGVAYIFYLKEFRPGEPTPFHEVATEIKEQLIQEQVGHYNEEYRKKLRKHYGMTDSYLSEMIPDETQPFALR